MAPQELQFVLNGEERTVSRGLEASYTLAEFLRDHAGLRGTKVTCREGGCGACTVLLTRGDGNGKEETVSVNSCLVPIYGLHGAKVTTIEGLGGRKKGYHPVQRRLAEMHGSQCGYCSPGMVMSICGSLCGNGKLDDAKMEKSLDGNLCRCTGYRPILDAAKSLVPESSCVDIEDLTNGNCPKTGDPCACPSKLSDSKDSVNKTQQLTTSSGVWFNTSSLSDVFNLFESNKTKRTKLVVGNTSNGVVKAWADVFIDVRGVPELNDIAVLDDHVTFGGNVTISSMIDQLKMIAETKSQYQSLADVLVPHLESVGSTPIRNAGCWAGNLMMQHAFPEFPSDLVPPFNAIGATLLIASKDSTKQVTVEEFLKMDMKNKVILSVSLPVLGENQKFSVFKVQGREAASHSYVTGGFSAKLTPSNVVEDICIGYIGLHKGYLRATKLESFMKGKCLLDENVISDALVLLSNEAKVETNGYLTDGEYRTNVAVNLFYKFAVASLGDAASSTLSEGLSLTPRGVSSGTQEYEEKEQNFPLNRSVPAVTSLQQTSGETCYTDDILRQEGELIAVVVPSQQAKAKIADIDTSKAKQVPGVHSVLLAADLNPAQGDKVLADGRSDYAGQPIAVVLATDERAARRAGRMIEVTYADVETPIIDLREAIQKENFHSFVFDPYTKGDAANALSKSEHVLEGECYMDSQYHMYMENLATVAVPTEEGFDIWASTQFPTHVQSEVANAAGLSSNCVNVTVTQLGGAFGGKVINPTPFAVITALSAKNSGRPVRLSMSLKNCMESTSKRWPFLGRYKVGFNKSGKIVGLHSHLYKDLGYVMYVFADMFMIDALQSVDAAYNIENMRVEGTAVKTDKIPPTSMRAPAKYPVAIMMDTIIAKVAHFLNKPIWEIQEQNLYRENMTTLAGRQLKECNMEQVYQNLKNSAKLDEWQKDIEKFNETHRWIKRGLATSACVYPFAMNPLMQYPAYVAIYASDGSVAVAHGGIEMGQGINTKVTQMVAKTLGVPMELIKIKPSNVVTGNNAGPTAGSVTMELLTKTVKDCCTVLSERIRPFREKMPDKSWAEVIAACHFSKVDLSAHSREVLGPDTVYHVYTALATEAEIDVLTGERRINRVDITFDCGDSMNPAIDVGQIEGALVMTLGHMLLEKEVYDPKTGRLLSNSTWDYKPPTCIDIPTKMNIHLLKDVKHTLGVMPAKALGEPPMCMAGAYLVAIGKAVEASRQSRGKDGFVQLDIPATTERVQKACQTDVKELTF